MTACVNCARTLQPAWKFCIYCGTRTTVGASATRARPLPQHVPAAGVASVAVGQSAAPPIATAPAPAPLSAAPTEPPIDPDWPDDLGERPEPATAEDVPQPTPPVEEVSVPGDRASDDAAPDEADGSAEAEWESATDEPGTDTNVIDAIPTDEEPAAEEPADGAEPDASPALEEGDPADPEVSDVEVLGTEADDAQPDASSAPDEDGWADLEASDAEHDVDEPRAAAEPGTAAAEPADEPLDEDDEPADRSGSVNTLAVLALLIGILACPLAAPFGHLALGQVRASGERGVIPAWIAIVLGYLWLGFWLVFIITYFATNG